MHRHALTAAILASVLPAAYLVVAVLVVWLLISNFWPDFSTKNLELAFPFILRTLIFAIVTAIGQVIIGLSAALCILWTARTQFWRLLLTTVFLVPYAIPASLVGLVFRFALGPQSIFASSMHVKFGVPREFWLYESPLIAASVASVWQFFPFSFLLCYLALRSIPRPILRSAQIDGASFVRILFDIILRRIWPILGAIFILRLIFMIVKFDTPFIFTETIISNDDVSTVQLWRSISGSSSPELSVIAWIMQSVILGLTIAYIKIDQRSIG